MLLIKVIFNIFVYTKTSYKKRGSTVNMPVTRGLVGPPDTFG